VCESGDLKRYLDLRGKKWREIGEDCVTKFYYDDRVKKDEIGVACSMRGGDEKCKQLGSKNIKGRDHSEDLGVERKVTLELILGKWGEGDASTACICLRRALVDTVINLWVP
jgi:hypothetical protein